MIVENLMVDQSPMTDPSGAKGPPRRPSLLRMLVQGIVAAAAVTAVFTLIWPRVDPVRYLPPGIFLVGINLAGEWLYRWRNDDPDV